MLRLAENQCYYDNLTIYNEVGVFDDQTNHTIGIFCGTFGQKILKISDKVMMIFKSDQIFNLKGFEIHFVAKGKSEYF